MPCGQRYQVQNAIIIRGRRAWGTLKATAAEQRGLWLEVGEALAYGKLKENREVGQKFSEWVQEGFPGLLMRDAADAQWFAENSGAVPVSCTLTHPHRIRQEFNEQAVVTPPTPELSLEAPTRLTAYIAQVAQQAKTINKLASMADRGIGQEKATAQRYLDKKAQGFGMGTAELTALSAITSVPEATTMISREIAELTGKLHFNILRDVRIMLKDLEMGPLSFEDTYRLEQNGMDYPMFSLPKDLTITLVSGYSVVMRHRIVTRWMELETQPVQAIPHDFASALRSRSKQR